MKMLFKIALCLTTGVLSLTAAETALTGNISDDMCGADHSGMPHTGKAPSARDCTLECAKAGMKFVFVSDGKVYAIANQTLPDLTTHAGHNVKVTADLSSDGKTITISKVQMLH